jgi:hypothetical protein
VWNYNLLRSFGWRGENSFLLLAAGHNSAEMSADIIIALKSCCSDGSYCPAGTVCSSSGCVEGSTHSAAAKHDVSTSFIAIVLGVLGLVVIG